MKTLHLLIISALMLLTACGGSSSHRPVYSGRQESTEGVPGFVNGKKVSEHVKLGQSYSVDGETYVPRHQPDYDETGMASWYGPGFHGGKTANGERFDANELTAAHRTLPLPSIVRVTMVSTGKQAYVRVNDRGPFSHKRIIDLSRAAAEKIGLLRAGVGKVRVEYMAKESQRFAQLLAEGRKPKSIDLASEVLTYGDHDSVQEVARADTRREDSGSIWASSAQAAEPSPDANYKPKPISNETLEAAPISEVESTELLAPTAAKPAPHKEVAKMEASKDASPFAALETVDKKSPPREEKLAMLTTPAKQVAASAPTAVGTVYVQLGAFQNQENAERLRKQYSEIGALQVVKKTTPSGRDLYHVRTGPYADADAGNEVLEQLEAAGAEPKIVRE